MSQAFDATYPGRSPGTATTSQPDELLPDLVTVSASGSDPLAPDDSGGTVTQAKEEAASVASDARESAGRVADTVKSQASSVAADSTEQVRQLAGQARAELTDQAATQQARLAQSLRALTDELHSMTTAGRQADATSTLATTLSAEAASQVDSLATWLETREPGMILDDVSRYARRKPGTFLAIAAVGGLVAGRLTRGLVDDARDGRSET